MKSCIVFGMARAGNHLVLKLLDMLGLEASWPTGQRGWPGVFDIPAEGCYGFGAHVPGTPEYREMFKACGAMGIQISRDLRDVVTSRLLEDVRSHGKPMTAEYMAGIIAKIRNISCVAQGPWRAEARIYGTTYEKLVGSPGGGTDSLQMAEIKAIHDHIGGELDEDTLREIAGGLYGPGPWPAYVRKAQIGAWKDVLTETQVSGLEAQMRNECEV